MDRRDADDRQDDCDAAPLQAAEIGGKVRYHQAEMVVAGDRQALAEIGRALRLGWIVVTEDLDDAAAGQLEEG